MQPQSHAHHSNPVPGTWTDARAEGEDARQSRGGMNHTQTLVRLQKPAQGPKVKTHVKAGLVSLNHAQTLVRAR